LLGTHFYPSNPHEGDSDRIARRQVKQGGDEETSALGSNALNCVQRPKYKLNNWEGGKSLGYQCLLMVWVDLSEPPIRDDLGMPPSVALSIRTEEFPTGNKSQLRICASFRPLAALQRRTFGEGLEFRESAARETTGAGFSVDVGLI
jgi:hypothetical protein